MKKNKQTPKSTELEEERGEDAMERKGRCCDDEGPPGPPLPFSLYEERATGARWLCAFLKHQLPEWSCREAMHCGTGVSNYFFFFPLPFFNCLLLKISLSTVHGIVVCTAHVSVVICFKL